jgi:hypothetical protein
MYSFLFAPGIRFNDCYFIEPVRFADWIPPKTPGVFAILACDAEWGPKPFRPLWFGEFGNESPNPLEDAGCGWFARWEGRKALFVAVCAIPFSTAAQRKALCSDLVRAYHPVLQAHGSHAPSGDLSTRLEEMERRHQDHAAQVMMLLGNIHKQFEPQPVPPRRRIGFLPESA